MQAEINSFFAKLPHCPNPWKGSLKGKRVTRDPKVYEVFVYSIVAEQFMLGPDWKIFANSSTSGSFIFRGSPGYLWGNKDFGYIALENIQTGDKYELHLGIQIEGKSKIEHEIDIGIFEYQYASNARNYGSINNIKGKNLPLEIECKYYDSSHITKGLGRQFLGMAKDTERQLIWKNTYNKLGVFITNGHDEGTNTLISYYNNIYFGNITPFNQMGIRSFKDFIRKITEAL